MGRRQIADQDGHRWDVEDEGPTGTSGAGEQHQLRFTRDDGTEHVRTSSLGVDQLADAELRALLQGDDPSNVTPGPDTDANRSRGYGDARD
jgi:hypothetical protein